MRQEIFTEALLDYLTSPAGIEILRAAEELDAAKPSDVARLRKHCGPAEARAVLELVELRRRARGKFDRAGAMFFDRKGYEQSSGQMLAEYKAARVKLLSSDEPLWDLCCGIGGDTIALAAVGKVTGIDASPVRVRMADLNLRVYGRRENADLACGDVKDIRPTGGMFHLDPDQRMGEKRRSFNIDELEPGREYIDWLLAHMPHGVIKFSPAADYANLPWEGEIELISHKGQCRQLLLWTGKFATVKLKATALPSASAITDEMPETFNVSDIQRYLYDPDPAVSRLRLLGQLAAELDLNFLAPGQVVMTADHLTAHPLARAFRVEEVFAHHEDKTKKFFRDRDIGPVTVKPRGVQVNVDVLSRLYSGKTGPEKVLFLLRLDKKVLAVVGEEERE